jgi:hypothetical protein
MRRSASQGENLLTSRETETANEADIPSLHFDRAETCRRGRHGLSPGSDRLGIFSCVFLHLDLSVHDLLTFTGFFRGGGSVQDFRTRNFRTRPVVSKVQSIIR